MEIIEFIMGIFFKKFGQSEHSFILGRTIPNITIISKFHKFH